MNVSTNHSSYYLELMKNSDPHSILRPPRNELFQPNKDLRSKIARYLSVVINQPPSKIKKKIPTNIASWGKVRIANGGDSIRTASTSRRPETERNMSFVRVCCFLQYELERTSPTYFEIVNIIV
jgi:hypothetical protein